MRMLLAGKRVYSSLLRRSLSHLSSVPPSPFLSQCLRPPSAGSAGTRTSAWAEDEDITAGTHTGVLNPWSDQEDTSGGKDHSSSRYGIMQAHVHIILLEMRAVYCRRPSS